MLTLEKETTEQTLQDKSIFLTARSLGLFFLFVAGGYCLIHHLCNISSVKYIQLVQFLLISYFSLIVLLKILVTKKGTFTNKIFVDLLLATITSALIIVLLAPIIGLKTTILSLSNAEIVALSWFLALFLLRINFLSKSGFYFFIGLFILSLCFSFSSAKSLLIFLFYAIPIVLNFGVVVFTRRAIFRDSHWKPTDFKLSFGWFDNYSESGLVTKRE